MDSAFPQLVNPVNSSSEPCPRTRGDGPVKAAVVRRERRAPPHTRGWTPVKRAPVTSALGSPAHAGMDPTRVTLFRSTARLPRTRGDGPGLLAPGQWNASAPPHTRGWTPHVLGAALAEVGSPAHAGMDPQALPTRRRESRLPRTRGDGPLTTHAALCGHVAPPHTRGWTPIGFIYFHDRNGSPAHAGMDRLSNSARRWSRWLPRTRGDGP